MKTNINLILFLEWLYLTFSFHTIGTRINSRHLLLPSSTLLSAFTGNTATTTSVIQELKILGNNDLPLYVLNANSTVSGRNIPLLFIHGSFHAAWCWQEVFIPYFQQHGYDCYAISLRGTKDTGTPPDFTDKAVKITDHVADVTRVLDYISSTYLNTKTTIISHSFGGMISMKLLEDSRLRSKIAAAVLLCSVPPSGNGPMTGRFIKRNFFNALKIVYGFVLKAATFDVNLCRELFFGDASTMSDEVILEYMTHFKEDSEIGLDIVALAPQLPSKTSAVEGVASWLQQMDTAPLDMSSLPFRLVMGAELDFIVDAEGVEETGRYFRTAPVVLPAAYHDVMLGPVALRCAESIQKWLLTI